MRGIVASTAARLILSIPRYYHQSKIDTCAFLIKGYSQVSTIDRLGASSGSRTHKTRCLRPFHMPILIPKHIGGPGWIRTNGVSNVSLLQSGATRQLGIPTHIMATNRGFEPLRVFNPGYRLAIWRNTYSANSSYGGKYKNRTYIWKLTASCSAIELISHVLDPFF